MDILLAIFVVLGIIALGILVVINYKKGYLLNNKLILISILCLILIIGFISYTSLPSNYIVQRIMVIMIEALGIVGCGLKLFNKGNNLLIRVLISSSLIVSFIAMVI